MLINIIEKNVSPTMNAFLIIANIINILYNIPQIVKTYQTKSTSDFSSIFIFLRIFGNLIWIFYAIDIENMQMIINNVVTVMSSVFIAYYKCLELYRYYREPPIIPHNSSIEIV
jgi:uncharacterized protein with PQ loop repeat